MRRLFLLLIAVLPSSVKIAILRQMFGYKIGNGVRIGFSVIDVRHCELDDGCSIGHLNTIQGFDLLRIGRSSSILNLNRITGSSRTSQLFPHSTCKESAFCMGEESCLTSRHLVDVQDRIEIGAFTTIAGATSQIWTHGIDVEMAQQTTHPVRVGSYSYIGARVLLLPGCVVPDRCVVAAGAVVAGVLPEENAVYAGMPAALKKSGIQGAYFTRKRGPVE